MYFLRRSSYSALITQVRLGAGPQFEVLVGQLAGGGHV
jgi:hypothetical protein